MAENKTVLAAVGALAAITMEESKTPRNPHKYKIPKTHKGKITNLNKIEKIIFPSFNTLNDFIFAM